MKKLFPVILVILTVNIVYADISVGILPFDGDESKGKELEITIKGILQKKRGISIVAGQMIKKIMEIHEKAQSLGSKYHDISKLKVAEYLLSGSVTDGKLSIKVININKGTEIYTDIVTVQTNKNYTIQNLCNNIHKSIELNLSSRPREIPSDALPYMNLIQKFTDSLKGKVSDSYPYIAFYFKGKHRQVIEKNKTMKGMAKRFINAMKPNLRNANLTFLSVEENPPWTNLFILSDKRGKKLRHKFGIVELDSGSLAIGLHEIIR